MSISDKFSDGIKKLKKLWLLPIVMLILDLGNLFLYERIFKISYTPTYKFFIFKLGIIDTPPSIRYIFEDFPNIILNYNSQYGFTGIIDSLTLFNTLLLLSYTLITSFLLAGYLSCLEGAEFENKIPIKYFFVKGNELWIKFFILNLITIAPIILCLLEKSFLLLSFIFIIFYYVKFSIVVDKGRLRENFSKGVQFFTCHIGLSIKMALFCGFIYAFVSFPVFYLGALGKSGIIAAMVIVYYIGMAMNMMALEVYRQSDNKEEIVTLKENRGREIGEKG